LTSLPDRSGLEHRPPPTPRARPTGATLAEAFDPRSNSLDVLRLVFAVTVAVAHTLLIGSGHQPQAGSTDFGSLAVDGFFVLSGFLVAGSWLRLGSLRRYAWHRALRILPGFWACLLGTALVVAPLLAVLSGRSALSVFSGEDSAWSYLGANAFLVVRQFGISGLPGTGGVPDQLDGSLWTLFFEAGCYALVALLGVLGVLARRRGLVAVLCLLLWALTAAPLLGVPLLEHTLLVQLHAGDVLRFAFVFLLGAAGHLFADRVPVRGALAAAALGLVVVGLAVLPDHRALAGPAFAYLCLYAAVRLPWRRRPRWDLSYGIYVWHFPVAQVLLVAGATALTTAPFLVLALALTAALAAASWNYVERPALTHKDAGWVTARRRPSPWTT
jgi:peptidoglycan/LPS O-acetylase OafA/YrhL